MKFKEYISCIITCFSVVVVADIIKSDNKSNANNLYKVSLIEEIIKSENLPILGIDPGQNLTRYSLIIEGEKRTSIVWQKILVENNHSNYAFDKVHLLGSTTHNQTVYIIYKDSEYTYLDVYKVVGGGKVLLYDTEMIPAYKSGYDLPKLEMNYTPAGIVTIILSYKNSRYMEFNYTDGEINLIKHIDPNSDLNLDE